MQFRSVVVSSLGYLTGKARGPEFQVKVLQLA